jgi:hypothetical protein
MMLLQARPLGESAQSSGTDTAEALLHLAFIVGMAGLLVGGLVAVVVLWYVRGRDPATPMVAEYITEPPDDLPPGAAGTLLDETVHHEDVVATLLGLARHGAIRIHEVQPDKGKRRPRVDYEIEVVDPSQAASRLEADLLKVLFNGTPAPGTRAMLRDVKARFDAHEPVIRHDLYQEMVDRKYFRRSPDDTRRRWRLLSWGGLIGSVVIGVILTALTDAFALLPTVAAVVVWIVMLRMSRSMPQKTPHGAEAAARWRAFRTYLRSIDRYENLQEARGLFDRYLSYAVAFGLEKQWLTTFAAAGAAAPAWIDGPTFGEASGWDVGDMVFDTVQAGRILGHFGGDIPNVGVPNIDLPNVGMPDVSNVDLQGMAEAMGSGLEAASGGLAGLLDVAGGIFDSIDFDL